ncbi:NUDIX domain-containing protein [Undibacterium sp. TS12]|uniref:NUDIX hydrolase n=1 Tax=Undibacterium sp. TS12 TaxID=2908202 RepID=UPI001F4D20BE|nr:NUDIX domain-containing protein [Undibacterium sp. TS12]MCH8622370.1 NUDIX domain-containing protein [Undibacterium sp. TS12]
MISFDIDNYRYNLRAAAIILHEDRILLHQIEGDEFWCVPGGRIDAGELAAQTIVREMQEELSEPVICEKMLWTVENFFSYREQKHHELGLYFLTRLLPDSRLLNNAGPYMGNEGKLRLTFAWFNCADLQQLDIRPSFLAQALTEEGFNTRHWVHHETA